MYIYTRFCNNGLIYLFYKLNTRHSYIYYVQGKYRYSPEENELYIVVKWFRKRLTNETYFTCLEI